VHKLWRLWQKVFHLLGTNVTEMVLRVGRASTALSLAVSTLASVTGSVDTQ
jgi:hypothetical protein